MKKIFYAAAVLLAVAMLTESAVYAQPLRLHILANSDSAEDQRVKLAVRDVILREADFSTVLTERSAEERVEGQLTQLLAAANAELERQGFSYTARAELGEYDFPVRSYAARTYPAGKYRALRIVLGAGAGHNWWCVLYPPLCTTATEDAEVKSFLWEWLKGVLDA